MPKEPSVNRKKAAKTSIAVVDDEVRRVTRSISARRSGQSSNTTSGQVTPAGGAPLSRARRQPGRPKKNARVQVEDLIVVPMPAAVANVVGAPNGGGAPAAAGINMGEMAIAIANVANVQDAAASVVHVQDAAAGVAVAPVAAPAAAPAAELAAVTADPNPRGTVAAGSAQTTPSTSGTTTTATSTSVSTPGSGSSTSAKGKRKRGADSDSDDSDITDGEDEDDHLDVGDPELANAYNDFVGNLYKVMKEPKDLGGKKLKVDIARLKRDCGKEQLRFVKKALKLAEKNIDSAILEKNKLLKLKSKCGKEVRALQRKSHIAREHYGKAYVKVCENNSDDDEWDSDIETSSKASDIDRMNLEDD